VAASARAPVAVLVHAPWQAFWTAVQAPVMSQPAYGAPLLTKNPGRHVPTATVAGLPAATLEKAALPRVVAEQLSSALAQPRPRSEGLPARRAPCQAKDTYAGTAASRCRSTRPRASTTQWARRLGPACSH
jgi:hypothetical protein